MNLINNGYENALLHGPHSLMHSLIHINIHIHTFGHSLTHSLIIRTYTDIHSLIHPVIPTPTPTHTHANALRIHCKPKASRLTSHKPTDRCVGVSWSGSSARRFSSGSGRAALRDDGLRTPRPGSDGPRRTKSLLQNLQSSNPAPPRPAICREREVQAEQTTQSTCLCRRGASHSGQTTARGGAWGSSRRLFPVVG